MSHTTAITSVVFTDIAALKQAVVELKSSGVNCELLENAKPRAYYSAQEGMGQADYVLKLNDSRYDVGFYKDKEAGGYVARTDLFGGDVQRQLGAQAQGTESPQQAALGKLYQGYAINAATRQAARQGYRVRRVTKADGTVQLVMNT